MLLLGIGFTLRWFRLQQALQWWYRQHVLRLFNEAEAVRNGVLQDAFTLRRTLELSLVQQQMIRPSEEEALLLTLGELHASLKRFSDFLAPPYLEDSFPIAIDYLLKSHQQDHPEITLAFSPPEQWQPDPYEQGRVVWMAIDELLRLALCPSVDSISASLTERAAVHKFVIQIIDHRFEQFRPQRQELAYLKRSVQFLTAGTCTYHFDNAMLVWSLQWS